jgi:hypothetical protein
MTLQNDDENKYQDMIERVKAVKRAYEDELLSKPNVVGVGIGFRQTAGTTMSDLALVVMVSRKIPAIQLSDEDIIPPSIDGVPVDVQEVGDITAF